MWTFVKIKTASTDRSTLSTAVNFNNKQSPNVCIIQGAFASMHCKVEVLKAGASHMS